MRLRSSSIRPFPEGFLVDKCAEDLRQFGLVCLHESCKFCLRRIVPTKLLGFGDDATVWAIDTKEQNTVLRCVKSTDLAGFRGVAAHMLLSSIAFKAEYARAGRAIGLSNSTLRTLGYPIIECREAVQVHKNDEHRPGSILQRARFSLRTWILKFQDGRGIAVILWQIALFMLILGNAFGYVHGDLHAGNVVLEKRLETSHAFLIGSRRYQLPKGTWLVRLVDMDSCRFKLRDRTIIDLKTGRCTADLSYLCTSIANIRGVDKIESLAWITKRRTPSFSSRALLKRLGKTIREV